MKVPFLLLVPLLCTACAAHRSAGPCGESFCLPPEARLLTKRTPVEDFNLYHVEWNGAGFLIYEGNAPTEGQGEVRTLPLPLDAKASLRRNGERGSVVMRLRPRWPNFLQIEGPCAPAGECLAATLARDITRI